MTECLNCGYERQPKDEGIIPRTECPKCGIIYDKAIPPGNEKAHFSRVPKRATGDRREMKKMLVLLVALALYLNWGKIERLFVSKPVSVPVPRDGMFYVEAMPAYTFKATLTEDWVNPHIGDGMLRMYAPVLPELQGQGHVSTRLLVEDNHTVKAQEVTEESVGKRPMLGLWIKPGEWSHSAGLRLRAEYAGTLFARALRRGKPPKEIPKLTEDERRRYLMASETMDHENPDFLLWMSNQGLNQRGDELAMPFAYRIFLHFVKNGKYGGDTSNYEARRPSRVCKSFSNDCGGLALLFVAVMRANNVPARTLFGRWAIPQTDSYGQYHVIAEFFVEKSGWVPVDISGTIVHKPKDPNVLFGNTDGQFLAFHIDTDLEPERGFWHAWSQYLLLRWDGAGDFWKEHRVESKWEVERRPAHESGR